MTTERKHRYTAQFFQTVKDAERPGKVVFKRVHDVPEINGDAIDEVFNACVDGAIQWVYDNTRKNSKREICVMVADWFDPEYPAGVKVKKDRAIVMVNSKSASLPLEMKTVLRWVYRMTE